MSDDVGGFLCRPPGMSVKEVREFNMKFASMNKEEQKDVMKNPRDNYTQKELAKMARRWAIEKSLKDKPLQIHCRIAACPDDEYTLAMADESMKSQKQ